MLVATVADGLTHVSRGATVVVASSGGPDSTALVFLVAEARPDLELVLTHVGHGLRDDRADRATVEQQAGWLGVRIATRDVEVIRAGRGIEAAARDARYGELREVAAEVGAATVVVGHTATDQAETVLLRLARGTGLDGLAAMAPVHGDLTRPLLRLRREDVHRFVLHEGLPYVDDPTNADPAIRRSLVRHDLLPALERVGPDAVGALARLADLVRDDAAALHLAAAGLRDQVRWIGPVAALPTRALASAPPALARRVVREVLERLTGLPPTAATVMRVLATPPSTAVSLPGRIELTVAGGWRALAPRHLPSSDPQQVGTGVTVWKPAQVELRVVAAGEVGSNLDRRAGSSAVAEQVALDLPGAWRAPNVPIDQGAVPPGARPERMTLALPEEVADLVLRHRAPGDRVRSAAGTRRLADVLGEAGLPRAGRAVWPVVASGPHVVWVPGFAVDGDVLAAGRVAPVRMLVVGRAAVGAD